MDVAQSKPVVRALDRALVESNLKVTEQTGSFMTIRQASLSDAESVRGGDSANQRFSTDVAWTLGAPLMMVVSSVGAGVIVARWLGAAGLGELSVLNISVTTMIQLGSAGLTSANIYFIAQDRSRLASVSLNALIFALVVGGALACGMTALAFMRESLFGAIPVVIVATAALSIPFQLITLYGLNIFLALGRVSRFNLLDVAGQSFVLINAVFALIIMRAGLQTLVSLNTLASICVSILIAWLIGRHIANRNGRKQENEKMIWRIDAELFWRTLRYGIKFHISMLAGIIIFRADLLVVNFFRGAAEAGVYGVASQMALMIMLLPGVIATLLFPRVSAEQDVNGELTCAVTRRTVFVMAIIVAAAVPFSFALPLLYGAQFVDATVQLLILLPGVYFISIESVLVQHFNATGLPRAIPLFWVLTLAVNIALTLALAPTYGARGAAVASTISYALIFMMIALYFRARTSRALAFMLLPRAAELREMLKRAQLALSPR